MALTDVYNYYRRMEDEQVILSFKGEFSAELLTSILHIMESKMIELSISMQMKKRVFNVLVECFQNLYHHIDGNHPDSQLDATNNSALIMVKYVDDKIMVLTGNYIPKKSTNELEQKLILVNELDQTELKELYQQRLLNNDISEKGTAGLGIIDIARKSKNELGYEFIDVNDEYSFFCLSIVIE
ncbi:MAG: SiaB family protein kinase [Crocinitomicaceae bacterium]